MKIYKDETAEKVCKMILATECDGVYDTPIEGFDHLSAGYWHENGKVIAYDNTDGCCWVEEFSTTGQALRWIKNGNM